MRDHVDATVLLKKGILNLPYMKQSTAKCKCAVVSLSANSLVDEEEEVEEKEEEEEEEDQEEEDQEKQKDVEQKSSKQPSHHSGSKSSDCSSGAAAAAKANVHLKNRYTILFCIAIAI